MTFPTVLGTSTYASTGDVTSWAPFTGVSVNRGSIVAVSAHGSSTDLTTASVGWAKLGEVDDAAASAIFYKTADGSNDLIISSSAPEAMTAILLRVSGGGTVSGSVTVDSGNPPTHTLPGVFDVLWVIVFSSTQSSNAQGPAGYSDPDIQATGGTNQPSTYLAYRTNRASSENPGAWSGEPVGNSSVAAWTIALYVARRPTRGATII